MSTALALVDERSTAAVAAQPKTSLLRPIAPIKDIIEAQNETRAMVAQALEKGRDYGVIPGTDKPTLLKPGGERLCVGFGLVSEIAIVSQEVDHDRLVQWRKRFKAKYGAQKGQWQTQDGESIGFYRYVVRCTLVHRESGAKMGEGVGSCSTMESKYIDRPRDCENTVLKMAKKRAFIDATLTTLGLSDQFTQDVEDMRDNEAEPAAEPAPVPEPELTLSVALAMTLPGKPDAWGGNGGKPLADIEPKLLASVLKWLSSADRAEKFAPLREAVALVLDAKGGYTPEPKPAKVEAMPAALADEPDSLPF
jgi:hypothetical protein